MKRLALLVASVLLLTTSGPATADPERRPASQRRGGYELAHERVEHARLPAVRQVAGVRPIKLRNFDLVGHLDPPGRATVGDVWVHRDTAYLGTWSFPCVGHGVSVIDVSDPANPTFLGRVAERAGVSAEDVVVRRVDTDAFTGDLLVAGIQRCDFEDRSLDRDTFGIELWDVTDPGAPSKLGELGLTTGGGGVHELDLAVRSDGVFVLAATPFSEVFDPDPQGDFRIVDVTDPTDPVQVADWGAIEHGLARGPFDGMGSLGTAYDHSARSSANGMRAYVSYWDVGVLTFDISDPADPRLLSRTRYARGAEGEAHSVVPYRSGDRSFLLQNDEDFDTKSPTKILFDSGSGIANEQPSAPAVWDAPQHRIEARVVGADRQGCDASDYPRRTDGKIVVVRTRVPFFDPPPVRDRACSQRRQERLAAQAGAVAIVHDFISRTTSPQWWDFFDPGIPALFTDRATARGMVEAGRATLVGRLPSWGFLRVFDAATGRQVASFDGVPYVHRLVGAPGAWSIHNTEVGGDRAYSSWYSHGIVALDLTPLDEPGVGNPTMVGQFRPPGGPAGSVFVPDGVASVWGVAVDDGLVFASDMNTGLWIVRPTGPAAP